MNTTVEIQQLLAGTNISQFALNQTEGLVGINTSYNSQSLINSSGIWLKFLGINTQTPTHLLNVFGNSNLSGNVLLGNGSVFISNNGLLQINGSQNAMIEKSFSLRNIGVGQGVIQAGEDIFIDYDDDGNSSGVFQVRNTGSAVFLINNAGLVGVGSTSSGFVAGTGDLFVDDDLEVNSIALIGSSLGETATGRLTIKDSPSERSWTQSAATELLVERGAGSVFMNLVANNSASSSIHFSDGQAEAVGEIEYDHSKNNMSFYTNAIPRMNIESDGDVFMPFLGGGTETANICAISATGQLLMETDDVCDVSSEMYKHDISPITYGLSDVMKFNPVSFIYNSDIKADGSTRLGFIVEEIYPIIPELVTFDNPEDILTQNFTNSGLDYSKFTAVLTKAIQEQQTMIQSLQDDNLNMKKALCEMGRLEFC